MTAMAGLSLNVLTENASRLGARIQETFQEHTRDLGGAKDYFDAPEEKIKAIRSQLDSNSDREKLDGLKRLVALISKGRNVSEFFPYVVKNVASPNLEIRKLVYIFLLRYAHAEPDLALLSINSFQRDLADPNPLIRAMALRVLSGINVPMVAGIVVMAIKKCAADGSPYVRKAAALALIKCYHMDSSQLPSLLPILTSLISSHANSAHAALSAGAAARALLTIAPTRLDILHPHFRRLSRLLIDADAWGQVDLLEVLVRYSRRMLSRPNENGEDIDPDLKLLLDCAEPLFMSRNPAAVMAATRAFYYLAPPARHKVFVSPLLRLLHTSREVERVVLSYIEFIAQDEPALFANNYSHFIVKTSDFPATKQLKLKILTSLLNVENWSILLREFTVYAEDSDRALAGSAIACIGAVARKVNVSEAGKQTLDALMDLVKRGSDTAISSAVLELKFLVQNQFSQAPTHDRSYSPFHIISSLASKLPEIKHPAARACVVWMVGQYSAVDIAEFCTEGAGLNGVAYWVPDVLREVTKEFAGESAPVKLQALTLASKLLVLIPDFSPDTPAISTIQLLIRHVFNLARYDPSYDVRDRARMLSSLLRGTASWLSQSQTQSHWPTSTNGYESFGEENAVTRGGVVLRREQVRVVLFEGKASENKQIVLDTNLTVTTPPLPSLAAVLSRPMDLDTLTSLRLPDWPDEGTDPTLRDSELEHPTAPVPTSFGAQRGTISGVGMQIPLPVPGGVSGGVTPLGTPPVHSATATSGKGAWMDLDKFYAEAEKESESESEDEDDSDEDDEENEEEEENKDEQADVVQADAPKVDASTIEHEAKPEESTSEDEDSDDESDDQESDEVAPLTASPWADR